MKKIQRRKFEDGGNYDNTDYLLGMGSGALKGASAGMVLGPIGAGVGAALGAVGSVFTMSQEQDLYNKRKAEELAAERETRMITDKTLANSFDSKGYGTSLFAMGGNIPMGVNGGNLQPLSSTGSVVNGNPHEMGGVELSPNTEVEGGEVIDGTKVFSGRLGFANEALKLNFKKGKIQEGLSKETDRLKINTSMRKINILNDKVAKLFQMQQMINGDSNGQTMAYGGRLFYPGGGNLGLGMNPYNHTYGMTQNYNFANTGTIPSVGTPIPNNALNPGYSVYGQIPVNGPLPVAPVTRATSPLVNNNSNYDRVDVNFIKPVNTTPHSTVPNNNSLNYRPVQSNNAFQSVGFNNIYSGRPNTQVVNLKPVPKTTTSNSQSTTSKATTSSTVSNNRTVKQSDAKTKVVTPDTGIPSGYVTYNTDNSSGIRPVITSPNITSSSIPEFNKPQIASRNVPFENMVTQPYSPFITPAETKRINNENNIAQYKRIQDIHKRTNAADNLSPEDRAFNKSVEDFINGVDAGDVAKVGAMAFDNIAQARLNKKMMESEIPKPDYQRPVRLKTNVDVRPQLEQISATNRRFGQAVNKGLSDSNNALIRRAGMESDMLAKKGEIYGNKWNTETSLINQDRMNTQAVDASNLMKLSDYKANKFMQGQKYLQGQMANADNMARDIVKFVDDKNMDKYQQQLLNLEKVKYGDTKVWVNTIAALAKTEGGERGLSDAITSQEDYDRIVNLGNLDPDVKTKINKVAQEKGFTIRN